MPIYDAYIPVDGKRQVIQSVIACDDDYARDMIKLDMKTCPDEMVLDYLSWINFGMPIRLAKGNPLQAAS